MNESKEDIIIGLKNELEEYEWNNYDKLKPLTNGNYLVCWSAPYEKEMSIKIAYFFNGHFTGEFAGANEILFWMTLPKLPEASVELRSRRVVR
jgi:hypothetical protein